MTDSRTSDFWIGQAAPSGGCRFRWDVNGRPCGAPVTLHVMSESAIHGGRCLPTCEPHAPAARAAGVYVDEHSPSWPGCGCTPDTDEPEAILSVDPDDIRDLPVRPEERLKLDCSRPPVLGQRPAYDPDLERRMRDSGRLTLRSVDGLTHYLNGDNRALCGAGKYLSDSAQYQIVCSANWRIVSCPTCRTTETR
jgi:hypothetical protein